MTDIALPIDTSVNLSDDDMIAVLTELVQGADRTLNTLNEEMRAAIDAEKRRIENEFRERRTEASTDLYTAKRNLEAARITKANRNPLVGKKVTRMDRQPTSKYSRTYADVAIYGVVEVMAPGVELPANMTYRRPANGQTFVRLMKKDGTLGIKIETHVAAWSEVK